MNGDLKVDLLSTTIYDSQLVQRSFGNTGRFLRNAISEEIVVMERRHPGDYSKVRHLLAGSRGRDALRNGDRDGGLICVSQALGLFEDIPSCADLMERMMSECREVVDDAAARFRHTP